jgi:hypothetical protein
MRCTDAVAMRAGYTIARVTVALALAGCATHTAAVSIGCSARPPAGSGERYHFGDEQLVPDQMSAHLIVQMREAVSPAVWTRTDFSRHIVQLTDFLAGGPPPDGIPPLDHPRVVAAAAANRYLRGDEPVLAVALGGHARAYPIRIMLWHEIANDVLGGLPIAVTYCPLCNSGLAFDRRVDGRTLSFGTTGLLRRSDLVMFDTATESWWQQFDGMALVGRLAGARLRMLPVQMLSWSDFKRRYPHGDVLAQTTGYLRPYGFNPYQGYDTGAQPFGFNGLSLDRRLPPMERVLAVQADGRMLAAPYSLLCRRRVIDTRLGRVPVVILYEQAVLSPLDAIRIDSSRDAGTAAAYDRRVDGQALTFHEQRGRVVDRQTGSVWHVSGVAVSGPLRGRTLRPLLQNSQFWFALAAFAPGTPILSASRGELP